MLFFVGKLNTTVSPSKLVSTVVRNVISVGKKYPKTLHHFARSIGTCSNDINIRFQISILLAWDKEFGADQDVIIPSAIRPYILVLYDECCVMPAGCNGPVPGITLKLTLQTLLHWMILPLLCQLC